MICSAFNFFNVILLSGGVSLGVMGELSFRGIAVFYRKSFCEIVLF
jgi:hypothetical protein